MSSEEKLNLNQATNEKAEKSDEEKVEEILKNVNTSNNDNGNNTEVKQNSVSDNSSGNKGKGEATENSKDNDNDNDNKKESKDNAGEVEIHKLPGKENKKGKGKDKGKKRPLRTPQENFEHDIITRYRTKLWKKFRKALQDFKLVQPGDKVAVAVSGGKDSLLMAKLFEEVQKHGDFYFDIVYLSMDPGFSPANKEILKGNCEKLGIDVKIEESDVFEVANKMSPEQPCFMCAKMRRGFLYRKAKEYGCNKLALGHHFDDIIETTLINIFYAGCYKTMVPKVDAENYEGITLIRPMVYIREDDIRSIMKDNDITCMTCGCAVASNQLPSTRRNVKQLIKELKENYGIKEQNIFRSAANVNLNGIYGYKDDKERFDYNDIYKRGKRQ
eukprot:jgi/Orpsp1_1/1185983/evm.model.c7180000096320.1